ncbi:MAG: hypothetical protein RRC34_15830 [Lentisphaeria bacterium]|nr:hypothetical protein [Lentisphaeria bacterium]
MRTLFFQFFCAVAGLLSLSGMCAENQSSLNLNRWLRNQDAAAPRVTLAGASADIVITWPGENRYSTPVTGSWRGWEKLVITCQLDSPLPSGTDIWVYTKDWDGRWRQVRFQNPRVNNGLLELTVPIAGDAAAEAWQSVGHRRDWHCLTPERIKVVGLKFENSGDTPFSVKGKITGVMLTDPIVTPPDLTVRNLHVQSAFPKVGSAYEARFELPFFEGNPFRRTDLSVDAIFTLPNGLAETVNGFYDEGFIFSPTGAKGDLMAWGRPNFNIRYCPRMTGKHKLVITVKNGDRSLTFPPMEFTAQEAPETYNGFLRVDKTNPRYISFDNGTFFHGLGVNTRSPTDTRHEAMVPHNLWRDEGLNFYRRVFPIYKKNGINVAEIWMSSWWLALEWIPDAPGNHGVGHYNQRRAFMLDQLLRCAEENDIYVILVFNNHGKFSTFCDQEWHRNPFNRRNGGYLAGNEDYFHDPRALQDTRDLIDYMVARWAHSPHILTWKLFSEINLTGASNQFYRTDRMVDWHRQMAGYFLEKDIYKHIVTTHWSSNYKVINEPVASLEHLTILTTDAYTSTFGDTPTMMEYLEGTAAYTGAIKKPVVITEFGGHPMGDSLPVLRRQLHVGNWYGFFSQAAVSPMLWWFAIVDEENFYLDYAALRAFTAGEDPRTMRRQSTTIRGKDGERVALSLLRNNDRMLIWGYDTRYYYSAEEGRPPAAVKNISLSVTGLSPGTYTVQHWNPGRGDIIQTTSLTVPDNGACQLDVPPFAGDFAIKMLAE